MAKDEGSVIILPFTGQRLYSEAHYMQVFRPHGLSLRSFRALCRALGVPCIHVGHTRFIDPLTFSIALRAVSRVGQRDFYAPGCEAVRKGRATPSEHDPRTLDLAAVIGELLGSSYLGKGKKEPASDRRLRLAARKAAERLAYMGALDLPEEEQMRFARQALKNHREKHEPELS